MTRVFLDANVLFAAVASPQGGSAQLLESCRAGRIEAVVSRLVLLEAERNIRKKLPSPALSRYHQLLEILPLRVIPSPPTEEVRVYQPLVNEKDAPILAAAVSSNAAYLVMLDQKGFFTEKLRKAHLPLRIVTPREFFHSVLRHRT